MSGGMVPAYKPATRYDTMFMTANVCLGVPQLYE
jgi:hypothetical protein